MKSWIFLLAMMALLISGACGGSGSSGENGGGGVTASSNEWTWMGGSAVDNLGGIYGSQGTASAGNAPGARQLAMNWTDASGTFWLYGGNGYDSTSRGGDLDDLWKYSAGEWTWMSGSSISNEPPQFGTLGVGGSGNVPGARSSAATWVDATGSLWLFGGNANGLGLTNDLWRYSAGNWTWMGGSNLGDQAGVYGTLGIAASGSFPGARQVPMCWTDTSGNFWLFGGSGYDSTGAQGSLNDLWKYNAGEWTWMGGSNTVNAQGTYGAQGMAAIGNIPGARSIGASWIDASGDLWLFGGFGYDSTGAEDALNDLWKYTVSTGEWTWVGGSNEAAQTGTYGTQGMAASSNIPGARSGGSGWIDASGNFWLFGGASYNPNAGTGGFFNDLWKYSVSTSEWTWMGGSNIPNQPAVYGAEGIAASGNIPGARFASVNWIDTSGNLWLFGGYSSDTTGEGYVGDLWKYEP